MATRFLDKSKIWDEISNRSVRTVALVTELLHLRRLS
jgi:hypothetical protein